MQDVQPPITNDQDLAGYRSGLERLHAIVADREADLFASQQHPNELEDARQALYRVYRLRQGIVDAIADYEKRQAEQGDQSTHSA